MNTAGLDFDNIPELRVPFGFFSTAPLFGVLAGLLLLIYPEALSSRWQPSALALVHLLTLGFAAQIMLGALCQVLPVISSQPLPLGIKQARAVRAAISSGTLLLAFCFFAPSGLSFVLAVGALIVGFGWFLLRLGQALVSVDQAGFSLRTIRIAAFCLLLTVISGALLLWWRSSPTTAPIAPLLSTDQHAIFGSVGWGLMLIIAVSFQVIPMFHVAPDFPRPLQRWLPAALLVCLLLERFGPNAWATLFELGSKGLVLLFCAVAAQRLYQRKRKLVDYTVKFWQLALGCIALGELIDLFQPMLTSIFHLAMLQQLSAVIFGVGGILAVIIGMLQKIVPFLLYLHLQRSCLTQPERLLQLPNMKQLIPTSASKRQWWLHGASVLLLVIATLAHQRLPGVAALLSQAAAIAIMANFGWLWWSLRGAYRLYCRHHVPISA